MDKDRRLRLYTHHRELARNGLEKDRGCFRINELVVRRPYWLSHVFELDHCDEVGIVSRQRSVHRLFDLEDA